MAKRVVRQDSVTEQLPSVLSEEEKRLIKLSEQNQKFERDELILPRLKILQSNNPECQEGTPQYIEGSKAGMFYNTASGKLTSGQEGMIICIVGHQKQTLQWIPREAGGGLVKNWGVDEGWKNLCEPDQRFAFRPVTKEGHTIDKQRSFLIFDIDSKTGLVDPSYFNFRSTNLTVANQISTRLSQSRVKLANGKIITPPHFYYTYKLTLERKANEKGSWWSPKFVPNQDKTGRHIKLEEMPNGQEIFEQAILFREQFMEGTIQESEQYEQGDEYDSGNNDDINF